MEAKATKIKEEQMASNASEKKKKASTPRRTVNRNKKLESVKSDKFQPLKIKPPAKAELLDVDKHRYNVRTILQFSNATPIRAHYARNGYACCFCKQYFHKAAELKAHTLQTHDDQTKRKYMQKAFLFKLFVKLDITSLSCSVCTNEMINFESLDELIQHLNTTHQKGIHTDVKNQIMCFKLDDEVFRCFMCSVEYHSFKNLLEHAHSHYRNFVCDVCDAGFINRLKLYGHVYNKHKGAGSHKCGTCEKVFDTPIKLKTHERIHSGTVLYKCHECGEKFSKKKEKRDHMIIVHGAEFARIKCTACDKMFISKASLSVHINRDHLMDRRHQCALCDKTFFTSSFLRDHMVSHSRVREIQCDECPKTFARKKALREHMKSHTGDRRFKCTYCDMAFLQKCSLKGHLRSRHDAELQ